MGDPVAGLTGPEVTEAARAALRGSATDWFEPLYDRAAGDARAIPWAAMTPHPYVLGWLDQPGLDVQDVDAVVVGCGLGDDAAELARRGCRVTAFDVSATAVDWARRRFAGTELADDVTWEVADVLDLPDHYRAAFGLVVEVRTVQSLPPAVRDEAMVGIGSLVAPGGWLVATTLLATSDEAARRRPGPPWSQAPSELAAYRAAGLDRVSLEHPPPDAGQEAMEVRVTFRRADEDPASG